MTDSIKLNLFDSILDSYGGTQEGLLENKTITFNGGIYPKFGHAITLTGGPASGKTTAANVSLPIDGKTLNIDDIKEIYIKIIKRIYNGLTDEEEKRKLLEPFNGHLPDEKNPNDNTLMHDLIINKKYFKKYTNTFFSGVNVYRKPNVIIDVTGGDYNKLIESQNFLKSIGYYNTIIWVVTDIERAKYQNKNRSRTIEEDYLIQSFIDTRGAMYHLLSQKLTDTDEFWILFTKVFSHTPYKRSEERPSGSSDVFRNERMDVAIPLIKRSDGSFDFPEDIKNRIEKTLNMDKYLNKEDNV